MPLRDHGRAMTWVSERNLVSAISNGGGFGVIASGSMSPDLLQAEIKRHLCLTDKPFGVNLITLHPRLNELIDTCLDQKVSHVVLAGGCRRWRHSAAEGRRRQGHVLRPGRRDRPKKLVKSGTDAIIIEGMEAGGHIGPVSTSVLAKRSCR